MLRFKFVGVWPCPFKDQASLRQVPSAVTPVTSAPAADSVGLWSAIWWLSRAAPRPPGEVQLRGLQKPVLKSELSPQIPHNNKAREVSRNSI